MTRFTIVAGIALFLFFFGIPDPENQEMISGNTAQTSDSTLPEGERLARLYCATCHLYPGPELLDKKTWEKGVLPNMKLRLGLRDGADPYEEIVPEEREIVRKLNIYPDTAIIKKEEFQKIVSFYLQKSPDRLPQFKTDGISKGSQFKTKKIFLNDEEYPKTSLLKYDSATHKIFMGDGLNRLIILKDLQVESAWFTESPPVDIDFPPNQPPRLLTIGSFNPSDLQKGRLLSFNYEENPLADLVNLDSLTRPVQFAVGDLNMDGKEDVVVCEFGNNRGEVAWYDQFDKNKKHQLKYQPGARKAIIKDMNGDGMPDIVVLMAQAREEILIFYNLGHGEFYEERVLEFPPVYGVNYFELADFNHDGFPDILLTNGDNWDYSPIDKNYHGVRIFENNGQNQFKETFFFPLPGASKAIAVDFDNDGDVDIALAGFYSSSLSPEYNFIYLENTGSNQFKPYYFPDIAGKWLTMESGDFNGDGKTDVILGSFIYKSPELIQLMAQGVADLPKAIVLFNQSK